MIKIVDTLSGVAAEPAGSRYAVFVRSREGGFMPITAVMLRDELGAVWHVTGVRWAGVFKKSLFVSLSRPGSPTREVELERYWEAEEGACATAFALASSMKEAGIGGIMPEGMWIDLSAASLERADRILAHE